MSRTVPGKYSPRLLFVAAMLLAIVSPLAVSAQRGGPPPSARAGAPWDITGYWTALITDDWEYRMVTPVKGQIQFVPLNAAARDIANAWDPDRDEQEGLACKGYGAAGIMRLPVRLHITWQDDTTLKIDIDNGTQTRLLHFGQPPASAERTWQGTSVAQWEGPANHPLAGSLHVVTTNMRPGYLRKNGVPYSENAVLTEWFNLLEDRDVRYLAIQTQVEDPTYLTAPFFRTLQFKQEPDGSKWNPVPCSAK